MTILLESQESSSPIITRAVSSALMDKPFNVYQFSGFQKAALKLLGYFPSSVAEWVIPRINQSNALSQNDIANLSTSDLVNARIADYKDCDGKYPAITLGVGMGGTTAHLALSLGGPFLPQAFVLTMKNGTMTGDVNAYNQISIPIAKQITKNNKELMTIQHYDPVHDGWLVKRVNHLRLKLIDLPEEYKTFIRQKLQTNGTVVYLEGRAKWKRFRTGDRNVFQVGGWGDISANEFIFGSERLDTFSKKEKLNYYHWFLDDFPLEEGPESEWGSESGLGEALEEFCSEEGYQFVRIAYEDPNDFSRLAYKAKKATLEKAGINPEGVVVEMFSQFDTQIVDQYSLLPLWLIFNTKDSLGFLGSMAKEFPESCPVFFSGLATFSLTPDLVSWNEWQDVIKDHDVINIGARESHFPADTLALLEWKKPLEKWAKENTRLNLQKISGEELKQLADSN